MSRPVNVLVVNTTIGCIKFPLVGLVSGLIEKQKQTDNILPSQKQDRHTSILYCPT